MTEYCIRCGAELGPLPYREVCDTCMGEIQRSLKTFTITYDVGPVTKRSIYHVDYGK